MEEHEPALSRESHARLAVEGEGLRALSVRVVVQHVVQVPAAHGALFLRARGAQPVVELSEPGREEKQII